MSRGDSPAHPDHDGPFEPAPGGPALLGRDEELVAAVGLLRDRVRLISVVGRSGVGKTRLAVEVARRVAALFPGGVVTLDMSTIEAADQIPASMAAALRVHVAMGAAADDALRLHLSAQPILIVADDADRTPGAALALHRIVAAMPTVQLLMTSQVPMGLPGEHVMRLRTLPVPAEGVDPAAMAASPAVALYGMRATAIDPGFRLGPENVDLVGELCRRLDGLPLAIELAAARTRILPLARQLDVLDRGGALDLRPRPGPGRGSRHFDLRATIAATVGLTNARERRILRRLGAFEASCPFDALGEVCGDPDDSEADVLDAIASLVELNLVEPASVAGTVRYRLLPTIRDFAREELAAADETARIVGRHTAWYATLAASARELHERAQVQRLAPERDELRAALARAATGDNLVAALALAADIAPLWHETGYFSVDRSCLEELLRRADVADLQDEAHVRALYWAALLATWLRFDPDLRAVVQDRLRRAAAMGRELASPSVRLFGLRVEALSIFITHDLATATAAVREGLALSAAVGDEAWLARFEYLAGMATDLAGDAATAAVLGAQSFERARRRQDVTPMLLAGILLNSLPPGTPGIPSTLPKLETLLELAREHGDREAELVLLARLAAIAAARGDPDVAAAYALDGLTLARQSGAWGLAAFCELALALLALRRGDFEGAARLHGMIAPVLDEMRYGMAPERRLEYLARIAEVRQRIGETHFDDILADIASRSPEARANEAVEAARQLLRSRETPAVTPSPPRPPVQVDPLTPRELDVLRALATGASNREIGTVLGLRTKTVMHYSMSVYAKLGVRGRTEAAAWAHRNGYAGERALD